VVSREEKLRRRLLEKQELERRSEAGTASNSEAEQLGKLEAKEERKKVIVEERDVRGKEEERAFLKKLGERAISALEKLDQKESQVKVPVEIPSKEKEQEEEHEAGEEAEERERKKRRSESDNDEDAEEEADEEERRERRKKISPEEDFFTALLNKDSDKKSQPKWLAPLIIFLGGLIYWLRVSTGGEVPGTIVPAAFILSHFIIFPLAGYALVYKLGRTESRYPILLPMLFFIVWFHLFGRSTELPFIVIYLSICALILAFPALVSKGQALKPELYGLLPTLFLFLDSGLLPYLTGNLHLPITPLTQGLLLYMPWWVVYGVLMLPEQFSEKHEGLNFFFGLLKVLTVLYIIITLVVPTLPNIGYESIVPSAEELEEAQAKVREQYGKKENPFISTLRCIWNQEYGTLQACVDKKQQQSEWKYVCEEIEKHKPSEDEDSPFQKCLQEQEKKAKNKVLQVGGTIDPTIRIPTTAKVLFEQRKFGEEYDPQFGYPFGLQVENPRKLQIKAEASCHFDGKRETPDIAGEIKGQKALESVQIVDFSEEQFSTPFICNPLEELNGEYELVAEVRLFNLKTISRLQRAFIGVKPPEDKERLRKEEISKSLRTPESLAPADLSYIQFDIGHSPKEIIIEDKSNRNILLKANVHNAGGGKLLNIKSYFIDAQNMVPDNSNCLQGSLFNTEKYTTDIPLPPCVLEYPSDLQFITDWVPREFRAELVYDYLISQKAEISHKTEALK